MRRSAYQTLNSAVFRLNYEFTTRRETVGEAPGVDLHIGAERIPSSAPLVQDTVDRRAVLFDRAHSDPGNRE